MIEFVRQDVIALNDDLSRARVWFEKKHKMPQRSDYSGLSFDEWQSVVGDWRKSVGYEKFMRRVGNLSRRKHGFVRSPYGGWMLSND